MKKIYKRPILPWNNFIDQYTTNLTNLVHVIEKKLNTLFISHNGNQGDVQSGSGSGSGSGLINSQYKMCIRTQHLRKYIYIYIFTLILNL